MNDLSGLRPFYQRLRICGECPASARPKELLPAAPLGLTFTNRRVGSVNSVWRIAAALPWHQMRFAALDSTLPTVLIVSALAICLYGTDKQTYNKLPPPHAEAHAKAHSVTDGSGIKLRFCQQCRWVASRDSCWILLATAALVHQSLAFIAACLTARPPAVCLSLCSKLQPIDAFEYDRRSCVASLHKRKPLPCMPLPLLLPVGPQLASCACSPSPRQAAATRLCPCATLPRRPRPPHGGVQGGQGQMSAR